MRASFSAKTPAAALIIGNFIRKLAGSLGAVKLKRFKSPNGVNFNWLKSMADLEAVKFQIPTE